MWNWIETLVNLKSAGTPHVLITVTAVKGSTPREVGAKMIVMGPNSFYGTIGGGSIERLALGDACRCLKSGQSKTFRYPLFESAGMVCGGHMELFMDVMNTNPQVYIFGAGHVGLALADILSETPFVIHLIDPRRDWAHSKRAPSSVRRHCKSYYRFIRSARWDPQTYAVIMTPNHKYDQAVTKAVLKLPARYIGLMGSKTKWSEIKHALLKQSFSTRDLMRVHCPIGLSIGGKSPKEIAISVAAEMLKTYYA